MLVGMAVEIARDDVIGNVAGCVREVAALPEALPPVALADVFELLLDLARRASLGPANEVADRDVRWYLDKHVDVIVRQSAVDDRHAHLLADLPDDLPHPEPHRATQYLEPILRAQTR